MSSDLARGNHWLRRVWTLSGMGLRQRFQSAGPMAVGIGIGAFVLIAMPGLGSRPLWGLEQESHAGAAEPAKPDSGTDRFDSAASVRQASAPSSRPAGQMAFCVYSADDNAATAAVIGECLAAEKPVKVSTCRLLSEALKSSADVIVLHVPGTKTLRVNAALLAQLKKRKVVGIGYGAAKLFRELGLEIHDGQCAHYPSAWGKVTIVPSQLLEGRVEAGNEVALFQPADLDLDTSENPLVGLYIPKQSVLASKVDVIARLTNDPDYAVAVRQGDCVLIGVGVPSANWSSGFQNLLRNTTNSLGAAKNSGNTKIVWPITEPGTYTFELGRGGEAERLHSEEFFFSFQKPTRFRARLEHAGSDQMRMLFMDEKGDMQYARKDAPAEPLEVEFDISAANIRQAQGRYWHLNVTNYDHGNPAKCTLKIEYDRNAVPKTAPKRSMRPEKQP